MKKELRTIFGDYINSGESGYFLLKNQLKEGINLSFLSSLDMEKNDIDTAVFYILSEDLKKHVKIVDLKEEVFNYWSFLLIFTEDTIEFKISQQERVFSKKTNLKHFQQYSIVSDPKILKDKKIINLTIKLIKESEDRKSIENSFFGKDKKDLALIWKKAILASSRYYIEELQTLKQIEKEEPLLPSTISMKELYEKRLSLWGDFKSLDSLKQQLYLTDFGIKDLTALWCFKEHFCSNQNTRESKSIEQISNMILKMKSDLTETLSFFQK